MATNELMTLIAETRERLNKMEELAKKMPMMAPAADKTAKKTADKRTKKMVVSPELVAYYDTVLSEATKKKSAAAGAWPPLPASMAPADSDAEDEDDEAPTAAPKRPANAWIKFTIRVNELLNDKGVKLPGAEQKQFCAMLKDQMLGELKKLDDKKKTLAEDDYMAISSETILTERKSWVKPETTKWKISHPESDSDASSKKRGRPSKKNAEVDSEVA